MQIKLPRNYRSKATNYGLVGLIKSLSEHELNFRLMLHLFPLETREVFPFTENRDLIQMYLFPIFKKRGSLDYFITRLWTRRDFKNDLLKPRDLCERILFYIYEDLL